MQYECPSCATKKKGKEKEKRRSALGWKIEAHCIFHTLRQCCIFVFAFCHILIVFVLPIYIGRGDTTNHIPLITTHNSQYGFCSRNYIHPNLPRAGFELRFLGPQAGVLPIEPLLLVFTSKLTCKHSPSGTWTELK